LYLRAGLSANEAGKMLGVSRNIVLRSAHDEGLPVRVGGAPPTRGPSEIELLTALYADHRSAPPEAGPHSCAAGAKAPHEGRLTSAAMHCGFI